MFQSTYFTVTSADEGQKIVSAIPFEPKGIQCRVGGRVGVTETVTRYCAGSADANAQGCNAIIAGSGQQVVRDFTDRVINALTSPSGTITNACVAEFVQFINQGGGQWGIEFDFTNIDSGNTWRIYLDVIG